MMIDRRSLSLLAAPVAAALALAGCAAADIAETPVKVVAADAPGFEACVDASTSREQALACGDAISRACFSAPGSETTAGSMRCAQAEEDAWRVLLDKARVALVEEMGGVENQLFASAEQAWSDWRDAECLSEAAIYEGGSLGKVVAAGCRVRLTADRALGLRDRLVDRRELLGEGE